jgi:hypothetical protein
MESSPHITQIFNPKNHQNHQNGQNPNEESSKEKVIVNLENPMDQTFSPKLRNPANKVVVDRQDN